MPTPNALECTDPRFVKAVRQMKSAESLPDAIAAFSEIIEESEWSLTSRGECKSQASWQRGVCQQRLGLHADDLWETLAYFKSAQEDFRAAVVMRPVEFARQIASDRWFPESDCFIPAYIEFLQRPPTSNEALLAHIVAALGNMGAEATEALPALQGYARPTIFKQQVARAAHRIAEPSRHKPEFEVLLALASSSATAAKSRQTPEFEALFAKISTELQVYPAGKGNIDEEHELTQAEVQLSQDALLLRLTDEDWAIRTKAACILGFTGKPTVIVVRALLNSLASDKRAPVRSLAAASLGRLVGCKSPNDKALSEVIEALSQAVSQDRAHPVRARAAEALAECGSHLPAVADQLTLALSNEQDDNVRQTLVKALGESEAAARRALPLIVRFKPHPKDLVGDVIKAAAIMRIAPSDHPLVAKCTKKLLTESLRGSRKTREAAIEAVQVVPLDDKLRKKALLERLFFDDCAKLRCQAARWLIRLDKDLSKKAGAYIVLDRIGQ